MSADLFKIIFDHTYQLTALLDTQGQALQVNQTTLDFAGVTLEEVVGQLVWETPWFPEEAKPPLQEGVRQAGQGVFVRYELDIVGVGGRQMAIDFSLRPVADEMGAITYLIAEGRDITKRRQVERALRQSEARFARLFYASASPVVLTTLAEGRFLDLNAKAELVSGFSREEVLGRTTTELGIWIERPFGGRSGLLKQLEKQVELRDVEMVLRRKDGELRQMLASFEVFKEQGEASLLTTLIDVTERNQMEKQLRESEARFRSAFHDTVIPMAVVSPDGRLLELNASVCDLLGYSHDELLALDLRKLSHPDDLNVGVEGMQRVLSGQLKGYQLEKRYLHKEGHVVWGHLSVSAVQQDDGSIKHLIVQVQDITARKNYEEKIRTMAYRDELTGLHNRRCFFERAPDLLRRARQKGWPVALIYLDLNGFKKINDALGHQIGDELLQQVGARFGSVLREDDLFARFGGDEFVILLPAVGGDEARKTADRLTACLEHPFRLSSGTDHHVGVSIGVVLALNSPQDVNDLLKFADGAMYRAKGREHRGPCAVEVVRLGASATPN